MALQTNHSPLLLGQDAVFIRWLVEYRQLLAYSETSSLNQIFGAVGGGGTLFVAVDMLFPRFLVVTDNGLTWL